MTKESTPVHVNKEEALYAVASGCLVGLGIGMVIIDLETWPVGLVISGYGMKKSLDGGKHVKMRTSKEKSSSELIKE